MALMGMMGWMVSVPALADTIDPFISAGVTHDDNLFRLSDDQLRQTANGADTYRNVVGGLRFERPVGRQLFSGVADLSSMKFERNTQLDYVGKDLSGEWRWFLASHFDGHIGASYAQVLAPFADFHSDQRNLRVTRTRYADGSWRFHPAWRWVTSYKQMHYTYDLPARRFDNRTEDTLTSGIDYLAASGSTLGFQLRQLKGGYPYVQSFAPTFPASGYVQDEFKVNVVWLATGSTQVLFLGGWVRRKQGASADRVDSGTNARLIANWTPTGRVKLVGQAWREYSAIDGSLIDSALTSGISTVATWDWSAKIQARADLKRETRTFNPYSGAGTLLASALFRDTTNTGSVGLAYKPLRKLTVNVSAFHEQRSGSVAAGTNSYRANGGALSVTQQF